MASGGGVWSKGTFHSVSTFKAASNTSLSPAERRLQQKQADELFASLPRDKQRQIQETLRKSLVAPKTESLDDITKRAQIEAKSANDTRYAYIDNYTGKSHVSPLPPPGQVTVYNKVLPDGTSEEVRIGNGYKPRKASNE